MSVLSPHVAALRDEIEDLKRTRRAVILAHVYQRAEVQHVADFIGDSLELCRRAAQTDAEVLVLCGVRFMAETAAILCPDRVVLLPEPNAGCHLADCATAEQVRARRAELPADTAVVSYVNSTAEVKAESDICCTSANVVQVVESLPNEHALLVPDGNLASWAAEQTGKHVIAWDGRCCVHDPNITPVAIRELKRLHHEAVVMAHPECSPHVRRMADFVGSTSQMLRYAASSPAREFIVGTEEGILHGLEKASPHKDFFTPGSICATMKLTTLASIRSALDRMATVVTVPEDVRDRAAAALQRMLAVPAGGPGQGG